MKAQNITTIAGTGNNANDGDDGPATCAGIPNPSGLCADGKGFLYIALTNSIRKIDLAKNTISRVAGSDTYGFSGDGGQAKAALLQFPYAICLDKKNNLYVSEMDGHRIRKIDLTTGIISTIAGTGTAGFSGDGGPAINASFNVPLGICTDAADNIYIADNLNHRIRKIDASTGIITTIGGNGTAAFSGDGALAINAGIARPVSVAADPSGNIFLAETLPTVTARVRKINTGTGVITTIAGSNNSSYSGDGGPATNANLFSPISICFDPAGNLFVAENDDSRIRVINSAGVINNFAGNGINGFAGDGGPATSGSLNFLRQITNDGNGNLMYAI
jgi:sugar lactone lactonase YvrE